MDVNEEEEEEEVENGRRNGGREGGGGTPVESRLLTGANRLPNNRRPSMHHRSSTALQLFSFDR